MLLYINIILYHYIIHWDDILYIIIIIIVTVRLCFSRLQTGLYNNIDARERQPSTGRLEVFSVS
jgi:hypothetical protein